MKEMSFPSSYKKAIIGGVKNTTLRFGNELGKYKKGNIYRACSYIGNDWKVLVRILSVDRLRLEDLSSVRFSKKNIDKIKRDYARDRGMSSQKVSNFLVEIIRFETKIKDD